MSQIVRSRLLSSLRSVPKNAPSKRSFSSSAQHDDAYECEKWKKLTIAGATFCTIFGIYILSQPHPHFEEPPAYPYLHIRNKEFPWGPDGLFERKHH